MSTVYIIDDEEHAALLLKEKLLDITDYFGTIEIFNKPILAYQAILEKKPDLIFSDIEMPHINGVDLHDKIAHLNIPHIYVTGYSGYTLKAIKLQAFDYILKPVKEEELEETVKRFILKNETDFEKINQQVSFTFHDLMKKQKDKIMISTTESVFFVAIESIVKIEAMNNYSCIYLNDKNTIVASKTLKYFERELYEFGFIRVHKSFLVNLIFIDSLLSKEGGQVLLKTGEKLDVTREKRMEIKEWFKG